MLHYKKIRIFAQHVDLIWNNIFKKLCNRICCGVDTQNLCLMNKYIKKTAYIALF